MRSQMMNRRRAEVAVAPLRPISLSRAATEEMLPSRGTLFLKGEIFLLALVLRGSPSKQILSANVRVSTPGCLACRA